MPNTITANAGDIWASDVDLSWFEGEVASDDMIAGKFAAAGFVDVTCTGSGDVRQVQGTWPGPAKTIALSDMDAHLKNFRRISPA
jgi:hypothetical protein